MLMALANLANVARSPEEWSIFSFSNQAEHMKASDAIFHQRGLIVTRYPLDPISPSYNPQQPPGSPDISWHANHQQWHNLINAILKTNGVDLTAVDFSRLDQAASWAELHLSEHQNWAAVLGLT